MDTVKDLTPARTPLYAAHLKASARMVPFAGWEMPLHYGSQVAEHHAVRKTSGVFDVSHMALLDVDGKDALAFLRYLLAGDVGRLQEGRGLYCCLLNPEGGIKDDLIVYRLNEDSFRVVVNAATRQKDLTWLRMQAAHFEVRIQERTDLAMLAVQGPDVAAKISAIFPKKFHETTPTLKSFCTVTDGHWLIARTGYTGEDGFEVMLPAADAAMLWDTLLAAGVTPCGLAARDTLRLEAGLNLYGSDMDETTSPLETGLAWTVHMDPTDRDFIGRNALIAQRAQGITQKRVGLVSNPRAVLRAHQTVHTPSGEGIITSGSFSPSLGLGIALARLPVAAEDTAEVTIRDKQIPVRIIRPPFVRHGQPSF